jgi:hypothetical protein
MFITITTIFPVPREAAGEDAADVKSRSKPHENAGWRSKAASKSSNSFFDTLADAKRLSKAMAQASVDG